MTTNRRTAQILSLQDEWTRIAGSLVTVQEISGAYYGFCSEIASLRIAIKYPSNLIDGSGVCGYSPNLNTWFFRLETK